MSSTSSESDRHERDRLIEAHLPLVRAVARRYVGRGENLDDLVQVGSIGLIKSSNRFDPGRGVAFATFATPAIEGEIRRHLADRTSTLRIPREVHRMSGELRHRRAELASTLGRSPTVRELAKALAADELDVERLLSAERARDSVPIGSADDTAEPSGPEPSTNSDDRLLLAGSVRSLDERERRIVFLRFHADMTEREIGRALGISQAHVSRLLGSALAKLRENLATTGDNPTGDTSPSRVISPFSEGDRPRRRGRRGSNIRGRADGDTRIAGVTGQQKDRTLEQYLELPYHVAVRSKREGARSWWTATVEELPGCGAQGSTPDEAVRELRPAMKAWLTTALAERREIPVPSRSASKPRDGSSYSGRFLVRMPSTLHEQLAQAAEREDTSLNRFVTDVLARAVTASPAARDGGAGAMQDAATTAPEPAVSPSASKPAPGSLPATLEKAPSGSRQTARTLQVALATNLVVVVLAGLVAVALLVLALQRGI